MLTTHRQLCTFFLDDQMFGLDVLRVQEINRIQQLTPVPLAPPAVRGLINLRGQIVTAIDLRERLGFPPLDPATRDTALRDPATRDPATRPVNIIIPSDDGPVSFLVDEVGDVIDVDDRDFEPPPATLDPAAKAYTRGVYKLPDRLLLVLEIEPILQLTASP
jgi:purine-binding chemotaxis protein CheW